MQTTGDVMAGRQECETSFFPPRRQGLHFKPWSCFLAVLAQFLNIALSSPFPLYRYHHTGPVTAFYSLRESLAVLVEEVGRVLEVH